MKLKIPTPTVDPLADHKLLTDKAVTELTGLNRRRRLELERQQRFPLPIRVSNKVLLYPSRDIIDWIEQRRGEK